MLETQPNVLIAETEATTEIDTVAEVTTSQPEQEGTTESGPENEVTTSGPGLVDTTVRAEDEVTTSASVDVTTVRDEQEEVTTFGYPETDIQVLTCAQDGNEYLNGQDVPSTDPCKLCQVWSSMNLLKLMT